MSLSWPSSSEASDDLDPFFEDLEAGITKLVNAAANSQLVDKSVWLMLTPNPQLVQNLGQGQEDALKNIVDLYNNRVPKSALWVSDNAKYKVLARFLTDMRRKDIVAEAEKDVNFPWHIERVHTILGWRKRGVNECVADLKQAIDEASRHKTSINKSIHDIIVEEDISFNR
ncbi:hypothetical protein TASIC1_0005054200 [Trichoderma asperellum]|uniref:Uncharacterized protein n=1 Tax=Trichoderma asperellum TaxID=101201 RepID=A0A6V8QSU8_TRIAP|nr:hypothetical protein TASIC1_0005054200 [Trichoderma asperellum]